MKKILQNPSLLFAFSLLSIPLCFAGGASIAELCREAQQKTLIIVVDDMPYQKAKKYKRMNMYEDALQEQEDKNNELLALFQENWSFNSKIEMRTSSEFAALKKSKDPRYIYMKHNSYTLKDLETEKMLVTIKGATHNNVDPVFAIQTLQKLLVYVLEEDNLGNR